MPKTLHPKSVELLKRVEQRLDNPLFLGRLLKRLIDEVADFYMNTPRETLKKLLLEKMTKGAIEYEKDVTEANTIREEGQVGLYSPNRIKAEKQEEMLDIIGWDFTGEEI